MDQFRADLDELIEAWDVWSIVSVNDATRTAIIKRSDEDKASVTIVVPSNYPAGTIVLTDVFQRSYTGSGVDVGEALDGAVEQWADEDCDNTAMYRANSSQMYEGGDIGTVDEAVNPAALKLATEAAVKDAREVGQGQAAVNYNESSKRMVVRIVVPVALSKLTQQAVGLPGDERVLVVELSWPALYLQVSDKPEVSAVFVCGATQLHQREPLSMDENIGTLKWLINDRLRSAIYKNHIHHERRQAGYSATDDTNCSGLPKFIHETEDFRGGGNTNFLIGVRRFMERQIQHCTSSCVICQGALPFAGIKTAICDKELCQHSMENYGLGVDVVSELNRHPVVCELLICLTLNAASVANGGRDVLNPMCPFELDRERHPDHTGPTSFMKAGDAKDSALMMEVIQLMPSIADMVRLGAEGTTALRAQLTALHALMYPLLQWILSSNRAHLQHIEKKNEIPGVGNCVAQFHLLSSNPQKESNFRRLREEARAARGEGSFRVWHGSGAGNWHCILRTGLKNMSNTKLMSAGAAYGTGIYTAKNFGTSIGYMGNAIRSWKNAKLLPHKSGLLLMALCELCNAESSDKLQTLKDHGNGIITVQDEDLINTRYLMVYADSCAQGQQCMASDVKVPDALVALHT
jgi:hypothetical protein